MHNISDSESYQSQQKLHTEGSQTSRKSKKALSSKRPANPEGFRTRLGDRPWKDSDATMSFAVPIK